MSSTGKARSGFGKGKNGFQNSQKRMWYGARTTLERGQERVLNSKKRNLAKFENLERGRTSPRPLSTSFQPFYHRSAFFHPFCMVSAKSGKKGAKNGGTGKERQAFFPVSFPFPFLPLLSKHISILVILWYIPFNSFKYLF